MYLSYLVFVVILAANISAQSFNATAFCSNINSNGLFPYQNSPNCSKYVKCYQFNGNFLGTVLICQGTTLFNPSASLCQDGYTCIPPSSTTTTTGTTSTTSTVSTSTVLTTTVKPPFNATAFCSTLPAGAVGYHPYPTGCGKYVYCYSFNSQIHGVVLTCLGTTAFDPAYNLCVDGTTC